MTLQRYRVDFGYGRYYFEPNGAGDWVKYEDVQCELQASDQAEANAFRNRDTAIQENERLRIEIDKYDSAIASRDLEIERLRGALECLLPGLVLDLRYAELDDDKDAMRSRIQTVEEALRRP